MVKRAPHSSLVSQGWVSKPINVSRQTWMVGPEYTWYMRCSCIKVGGGFGLVCTAFSVLLSFVVSMRWYCIEVHLVV
jgi:hypothetical protein